MTKATSLYLDLMRFFAALVVFVSHASYRRFTDGLLWQVFAYNISSTAVMVFFVLSGYVIAQVTSTREKDGFHFAASRFGRLYSVVFPAIILTIICEYITLNDDVLSNLQIDSWGRVVRYAASFFFVNRYWFVGDLEPVWNSPFWSLSYEATYYVAAALIIFGNRKICAFGLVILALLAGPSIVVLAPIWFLGYGTYFYSRRRRFGPLLGLFLWFASVGVLLFASLFNEVKSLDIPVLPNRFHGTIGSLLADYTAGIAFAVHLISFQSFESKVKPALLRFQNTLRWLGSLTFVLYLFHLPLLKLFSFYSVGGPGSSIERIWILGGTLLTVAVIGPFIERSKIYYRRAALWALQHMPMTRYRIQAVQEMLRTD